MPLMVLTPIRAALCSKAREQFASTYGEPFLGGDTRILNLAIYLRVSSANDDEGVAMLIEQMLEANAELKLKQSKRR